LLDAWVPKDAKPGKGEEHRVTPTLVLRESTGPAPGIDMPRSKSKEIVTKEE
jgi:hypothetical protein